MAYEIVEPTLIANTTMEKYINSAGVHRTYRITPNEGYVLHDIELNTVREWDENGDPIYIAGYTTATCTCAASYDFTANSREFFAVLRTNAMLKESE